MRNLGQKVAPKSRTTYSLWGVTFEGVIVKLSKVYTHAPNSAQIVREAKANGLVYVARYFVKFKGWGIYDTRVINTRTWLHSSSSTMTNAYYLSRLPKIYPTPEAAMMYIVHAVAFPVLPPYFVHRFK